MPGAALRGFLLWASANIVASAVDRAAVTALADGDECAAATGGQVTSGCALSALQRHARGTLRARQEQPPVVAAWGQCGGTIVNKAYNGPTSCIAGYTCVRQNKYYSQCKPEGILKDDPVLESNKDDDSDDEDDDTDDGDEGEDDDDGAPAPKPVPLKPNPPTPKPRKVKSVNPIVIKGNYLYDSVTGKRFFVKGVAYNPRNSRYDIEWGKSMNCTPGRPKLPELDYADDVIVEELEEVWRPALTAIANLGANTVRLYNIDPDNDHSKFMQAAAELGLYVIVPLTRKEWGYLPAFPAPDCYTKDIEDYGNVGVNLLTSGKLIVKEFSQWDNTLLFTIANEMTVNDKNGFAAFPCVKAYTRDIHRYQESCGAGMRRVPLIYADVDIGSDRTKVGDYMTCEVEDPDDAVDAYGINVYSWCDKHYRDKRHRDSFRFSPYYKIKRGFRHFKKPVLFTEFGCNKGEFETHCPYKGGRTWPDVKAIVRTMGSVLSGAIAFEFSMEDNEFGLALTPGFLAGQDDIYLLDNYFALQKQYKKYHVSHRWDAKTAPDEAMADCNWSPNEVESKSVGHARCPSSKVFQRLQRKRRVDKVTNWLKLPPAPIAPLSDVHNQSECPTYAVTKAAYMEGCCHMRCR